jgi:hypothetical protein
VPEKATLGYSKKFDWHILMHDASKQTTESKKERYWFGEIQPTLA